MKDIMKTTPKEAIRLKCKDCIYDPYWVGTYLQQIAACCSANCALHPHRPLPRQCRKNGEIDPAALAEVRRKYEELENRERDRRRCEPV